VGEYSGQILCEDQIEGTSRAESAYLFDLGDGLVVDAERMGNATWRMNHNAGSPNVSSTVVIHRGVRKVCMHANVSSVPFLSTGNCSRNASRLSARERSGAHAWRLRSAQRGCAGDAVGSLARITCIHYFCRGSTSSSLTSPPLRHILQSLLPAAVSCCPFSWGASCS
jgi:hypothetical protein